MNPILQAYKEVVANEQQELEEGMLRNLAIATTIGAAALGASLKNANTEYPATPVTIGKISTEETDVNHPDHLLNKMMDKFNVKHDKAQKIVNAATKYADPVFPQAHHLIAIAGVESSFNEKARSKLKFDPAVGLMQVRPQIWGIHPSEFSTIDGQIKHGAEILRQYHRKTGSPDAAIKAYNVGLTNFNKGKMSDASSRYHGKISAEIDRIKN